MSNSVASHGHPRRNAVGSASSQHFINPEGPIVNTDLQSVPTTSYRHRFALDEFEEIEHCLRGHGFAVVEGVLDDSLLDGLASDVRRICATAKVNENWGSSTSMNFVEQSHHALRLLEHQPYMRLIRHLHGTDELCLHRSAAILRNRGRKAVSWHSDLSFRPEGTAPRNVNEVLNRRDVDYQPFSAWFYLTGSRPKHGGLSVIEDSQRSDWTPPAGFRPIQGGKSFCRIEGPDQPYDRFDVPGAVPVIAAPGDLLLFDRGTYHAAHPNHLDQARLSCAVGLRPRRVRYQVPWQWPESARALEQRMPAQLRPYLDGYTSIDQTWKAED